MDTRPKYTVGGHIAKGGMGAILRAKDSSVGRTVAMKVLLDGADGADPTILERFQREAQILGQLEHPNIVPMHDMGTNEQGRPFYTMKLVKGRTLQEVINGLRKGDSDTVRDFSLSQLLTVLQKVCDAVAYAHAKGVVHRDLKPDNVMIGKFGEVMVMDWGIAKVLGDRPPTDAPAEAEGLAIPATVPTGDSVGADSAITLDGAVVGTPQYMAPEQAEGRLADVDPRTDIFSLGGILYSILALRPPTGGTTVDEILSKVRSGDITSPLIYNLAKRRKADGTEGAQAIELVHCPDGEIPEALSAVAMKALALDQAGRYQTVADFQADITAYQTGFVTSAEEVTVWKQLKLLVLRHKAVAASGAIILLLIVAFMGSIISSRRRAVRALENLSRTAPTFAELAEQLVRDQKFTEALEKLEFAVTLRPGHAEYLAAKGNLLQSLLRFTEAREAYQAALQAQPNHALARENLDLCKAILTATGAAAEPDRKALARLQSAMIRQGRGAEAVALLRHLGQSKLAQLEAARTLLNQAEVRPQELRVDDASGLLDIGYGASKTFVNAG